MKMLMTVAMIYIGFITSMHAAEREEIRPKDISHDRVEKLLLEAELILRDAKSDLIHGTISIEEFAQLYRRKYIPLVKMLDESLPQT